MSAEHGLDNILNLKLGTVTVTGVETGIDCNAYDGIVIVDFNIAAGGAAAYNVPKIQHSSAVGGTYVDVPGATVTQGANAALTQSIAFNIDALDKFLRVSNTVTGTYSAVTSVTVQGRVK